MEVILLENIRNLGKFGAKVRVAKGFGRNYLIPKGKAVPATKENLSQFESQRADLEQAVKEKVLSAQKRAEELNQLRITLAARAGDEGKLYGSIGTIELVKVFKDKGFTLARQEIRLPNGPLRELGEFVVEVQLHAEVVAQVHVTIVPDQEQK